MGMPPAGTRRPQTPAATGPDMVKDKSSLGVQRGYNVAVIWRGRVVAVLGVLRSWEEAGLED
jgi:hypothetical protein